MQTDSYIKSRVVDTFYRNATTYAASLLKGYGIEGIPIKESDATYTDGEKIYIGKDYQSLFLQTDGVVKMMNGLLIHEVLHLINSAWPSKLKKARTHYSPKVEKRYLNFRGARSTLELLINYLEDWRIMVVGSKQFLGVYSIMGYSYKKTLMDRLNSSYSHNMKFAMWLLARLLHKSYPHDEEFELIHSKLSREQNTWVTLFKDKYEKRALSSYQDADSTTEIAMDFIEELCSDQSKSDDKNQGETSDQSRSKEQKISQAKTTYSKGIVELIEMDKDGEKSSQLQRTSAQEAIMESDVVMRKCGTIDKNKYDSIVRNKSGRLVNKFYSKMFSDSQVRRVVSSRGKRVRRRELSKVACLGGYVPNDMYFNTTTGKSKSLAIQLMVDCSYSMSSGEKFKKAEEAMIVMSDVFHKMNFPFSVMGFTTTDRISVNFFSKDFEDSKYHVTRLSGFFREKANMNKDGRSLEFAAANLLQRCEDRKIVIMFSDGLPSAYSQRDLGFKHIKRTREMIESMGVEFYDISIKRPTIANEKEIYGNNTFKVDSQNIFDNVLDLITQKF